MTVWHRNLPDTVDAVLDRAIDAHSADLFLDFSGDQYTYGDVGRMTAQIAHTLTGLGVGFGDTVVLLLDNSVDAVSAWFGANRIGAICVAINTAYRGEFLRHQIADAGARVVIAERDYAARIVAVAEGLAELRTILVRTAEPDLAASELAASAAAAGLHVDSFEQARDAADTELPGRVAKPSDLSTLIYTAGTTGPSKGCMISHNYTLNLTRQYLEVLCRRPDESAWTPLPLFHFNAWSCTVMTSAVLGSSGSIAPRFSLSGFWPEIERTGARVTTLLGPMVTLIAQAPDNEAMFRCRGQLRIVQSAPFPPDYVRIWKERFGVQLAGTNAFGLTECCLTTHLPLDQPAPPGSSGRRNDDFDVRIFDDEDNELPPGTAGEIVVRPRRPDVMFSGYWRRPEATAALMRNLWFHTGDIGKFDEEGYFYFVDRKKDYLRRRGENISSFEMETAFLAHPDLSEVAVHAVLSDVTEDDVKVTAVLRPGSTLTEQELCEWSIERLPYFAIPRYIEFRTELPKNPVGRVMKYVLRDEGATEQTWDREKSDLVVEKR
jgi:crotonobetaine/carnitine-CoA ligase